MTYQLVREREQEPMTRLNQVTIIGRLSRDPESKSTTSGKQVCQIGIAVDSGLKDSEGNDGPPHWFDVTGWENTAIFMQDHFKKGQEILIQGRLHYRAWLDESTGTNRSKVDIVALNVGFVGSRGQQPGGGYTPSDDEAPPEVRRPATNTAPATATTSTARPATRQNTSDPARATAPATRPRRPPVNTDPDDESDPFEDENNYK